MFTLSLARGLHRDLAALCVDLADARGQVLGPWKPWRGNMADQGAAGYRAVAAGVAASADWTALLAAPLLPRAGHEWLWRDRAVFDAWLAGLTGQDCPQVLQAILRDPDGRPTRNH